ncbi:MAG: DUF4157 domain-containing protein, partial [Chloroflexi bacterium]|nr:DUF4157 domain-containing protein [Chloroflexota bacterium]
MSTVVNVQPVRPASTAVRVREPQRTKLSFGGAPAPMLQRQCACGGTADVDGECEACRRTRLQRSAMQINAPATIPPIVHDVLRSSGQPLDARTRTMMGSRFEHDFSRVRVHRDARAAESARAVNALAYTVGRDVVFAAGQFAPQTIRGRQLLAHELTHVVQQSGSAADGDVANDLSLDSPNSPHEAEARTASQQFVAPPVRGSAAPSISPRLIVAAPLISRASPDAVGYVLRLGQSARTGLQFWPTNVTDTRVGPVTVQGGLQHGGASRLHVIVGENLTPRTLARQLLPLWNTATPFTPPGAAAPNPLVTLTEDELAKGLLVYNQTYLPVPAMTNWRSGLRFPLPVEIDPGTGVATLHPLLIQNLATGCDPVWLPLLDRRATATTAPAAATVQADVAAFLTREPTAL